MYLAFASLLVGKPVAIHPPTHRQPTRGPSPLAGVSYNTHTVGMSYNTHTLRVEGLPHTVSHERQRI